MPPCLGTSWVSHGVCRMTEAVPAPGEEQAWHLQGLVCCLNGPDVPLLVWPGALMLRFAGEYICLQRQRRALMST